MYNIASKQGEILKKVKKFFSRESQIDNEISLSDYYYFCSWSDNFGNWCLKNFVIKNKNFFEEIRSYIKFVIETSLRDTFQFETLENSTKKKYKNLIVTYSNFKNLKKKKLFDNYFATEITESNKTLWIIINVDKQNSFRSQKNIIIIQKKEKISLLQPTFYFSLLKNFFLILFFKKKIIDKIFFNHLKTTFKNILKNNKIKKTFIPYESQPHQHAIIKILKEYNDNIEIIGSLHSSLTPLPTDFIYKKKFEPDKLIVSGALQKKILEKYLGWPKDRLFIKNSFRYQKSKKSKFSNKVYLSYSIGNPLKTFSKIEYLINEILKINFSFKIINHPIMEKSSSHTKLLNLLKKNFNNHKYLKKKNKETIVIGVSAIILEILENGKDVFHICDNPLFEAHSSMIWEKINVKKLENGIYHYSLKHRRSIIKFGSKNLFKKTFDI